MSATKSEPEEAWLHLSKGTSDEILQAKRSLESLKTWVKRRVNSLTQFATDNKTLIEDITKANNTLPDSSAASIRQEAAQIIRDADEQMSRAENGNERFKALSGLDTTTDNTEIKRLDTAIETLQTDLDKAKTEVRKVLSQIKDSGPTTPVNGPNQSSSQPKAKPVESLKPEALDVEACPRDVENWIKRFIAYYQESKFHAASLSAQKIYLENCLSERLRDRIFTRAPPSTPVDPAGYLQGASFNGVKGYLHYIKAEFDDAVPKFNRLMDYITLRQKSGEQFEDFHARLMEQHRLADIENLQPTELHIAMIITGCNTRELKKEFLKLDKPTEKSLIQTAQKYRSMQSALSEGSETVNAISGPTKSPCVLCGDQCAKIKFGPRQGQFFSHCSKCFRDKHYLSLKCDNCKTEGNHATIACKGSPAELPKEPRPQPRQNKPEEDSDKDKQKSRKGARTDYSKKNPSFRNPNKQSATAIETDDNSGSEPDVNNIIIKDNTHINSTWQNSTIISYKSGSGDSLDNMEVKAKGSGRNAKPHRVKACPDSGCRTTIVGDDIAKAIAIELEPTNVKIKAANHSTISTTGSGIMTMTFEGQRIKTRVIISTSIRGRLLVGRRDLISLGVIPPSFPSMMPGNIEQSKGTTTRPRHPPPSKPNQVVSPVSASSKEAKAPTIQTYISDTFKSFLGTIKQTPMTSFRQKIMRHILHKPVSPQYQTKNLSPEFQNSKGGQNRNSD